jgi:hypothetical protein
MKPSAIVVDPREQGGFFSGWTRFWFAPADPFGLHLTRLLTGILLLSWLLPLHGDVPALFGLQGWFDRQALSETARLDPMQAPKPLGWSLLYLCGNNVALLQTMYWGSIAVLVLFTLGIATRLTVPAGWVIVASFTATPLFDEEVDSVLQFLTLYLGVAYLLLGQWNGRLSLLERLIGSRDSLLLGRIFTRSGRETSPSVGANVALRLLQIHVAILLVSTGLHKLQIGEWWAGVAYWFNWYPAMGTTVARAREHARDVNWFLGQLNVMAYLTLAWQITFPFFAWRAGGSRVILLGGALAGWVGLVVLYQMPYFGLAFFICCLAFLSGPEWAWVGQLLQRVSTLKPLGAFLPEPQELSARGASTGSLHSVGEK